MHEVGGIVRGSILGGNVVAEQRSAIKQQRVILAGVAIDVGGVQIGLGDVRTADGA